MTFKLQKHAGAREQNIEEQHRDRHEAIIRQSLTKGRAVEGKVDPLVEFIVFAVVCDDNEDGRHRDQNRNRKGDENRN